jgi:hypothetical protein
MMRKTTLLIILIGLSMLACKTEDSAQLFERENLVAWCIVPFDAAERTPVQRALMLKELGFTQMAYDYREQHIPSFKEEIETLKVHHISLAAVWLWVDPRWEEPLDERGQAIFETLGVTGTATEIWVGFPEDVFEGLSHEKSLSWSIDVVKQIQEEAEAIDCSIALYNHGGWFGEPENLVEIIESIASEKIRIVYNFHHAHHEVDRFRENLELMLPYLSTINLNGMRVEGPKIIPLGEGDREEEMLKIIQHSGYAGPIGIIGHTEGEDIRGVLENNLAGLEKLKQQL